jgi:ABC-type nitrate/sulfonate/bicarbonate transport system substrate-binding protein
VEGLVVGIFSGSDSKALESALSEQQIDLSKVKVVGGRAEDPDESQLEFVDVIEDMESNSLSDDMTAGVGVWDETGTSVPGIGGRQATLESFSHRDNDTKRYFSGFPIPTDEIENFDDAVADGRSVVLYPDAGSNDQTIAAAFKAAGLRNVRAY